MKLQEFIELCGDEDIFLHIYDDESGDLIDKTWKSGFELILMKYDLLREVQSYYHTKEGNNLVMEIYVK